LTEPSKTNPINPIWGLFSSVRLTIVLLITLAVTSILGTVIPQQEAAIAFAQQLNPGLANFLQSLQLFDMYHSIWFRLIIGLLTVNLVICSLNRLPTTLKRYRSRPSPERSRPFENISPDREILAEGDKDQIRNRVWEYARGRYRHMNSRETAEGVFLYGDRGRLSYFGVYIVHFSFLLILAGASIGSLFGFEAYVNIPEGETVDSVALRKSEKHEHKSLGFQVRCDKFNVDFYEDGTPKEYRSELSFLDKGKKLFQSPLLVNHPVSFRGINFYQSSYGTIVGNKVKIRISRSDKESEPQILVLERGRPVKLPDNKGEFTITHAKSDHMRLGAAVHLVIQPDQGKIIRFWLFLNEEIIRQKMPDIFERFETLNPAAYKPYIFSLVQIDSKYYTGLQVSRDPGVPFVWLGFILIMIGLFLTFFTSHQQIWIRLIPEKEKIRISIAGRANKNPLGLERDLDRLIKEISLRIEP